MPDRANGKIPCTICGKKYDLSGIRMRYMKSTGGENITYEKKGICWTCGEGTENDYIFHLPAKPIEKKFNAHD